MTVKTKGGFVCEVKENRVKDYRFVKALAKCDTDSTSYVGISEAVNFLLGDDGEAALMAHVTDKDGNIPTEAILNEFKEIMQRAGEQVKKSQSSPE